MNSARAEAQAELAKRQLARGCFADFCRYMVAQYPQARHLAVLAEHLEAVERYVASSGSEGIGRLMVFMPPRYWKSTTCSVLFPQWFLGRNPAGRVILTSYASGLAVGFSRKVRNGIQSSEFEAIFGARSAVDEPRGLAADSRAADEWELAAPHRGGMTAAGVGSGITGKGANLLIVDDPVKDRKEAESERQRAAIWDWWTSTAYTRLEDNAAVVVIMTRWHEDDLAGKLLAQMVEGAPFRNDAEGAEPWQVLMLAARAEAYDAEDREQSPWLPESDPLGRAPGEALWPAKHDKGELAVLESLIGAYDWSALFQQRPTPRSGGMFQEADFVVVDELPRNVVQRVRWWDKAATAGGGDWTCGVCMSRSVDGLITVEHVARGQWGSFEREAQMKKQGGLDRTARPGTTVIWHEQEPGSAGVDSAKATNANLAKVGLEAHFERTTGDKKTVAGPWSSACEAGLVRLVRGGWNRAFVDEHVGFPRGAHDDQVDAASKAYLKVGVVGVLDGQLFF